MSEIQIPKDRISTNVNLGKPQIDSEGLYFEKETVAFKFVPWERKFDNQATVMKTEKVRPDALGYKKQFEMSIIIEKLVQGTESLENELVYFEQKLTVSIPEEARYKYLYLFKTRSGEIFFKDFDSGTCSQININDAEFVRKSKAKKLRENTILPKNVSIFQLVEGELRRRVELRD
jgi:hypothetical protein